MATPTAIKRLNNDYKDMLNNPIPYISVKVRLFSVHFRFTKCLYILCIIMAITIFKPDPENILVCHYCIKGAKDSVYEGGYYYGKVIFPVDFPFKPPAMYMMTPSGRFVPGKSIW